jgi:ABC-type sugar transport system permease subunit
MLTHYLFVTSVRNTFSWAFMLCLAMLPLSLFVAVLIVSVKSERRRGLYQSVIFVPYISSLVAVSLLFIIILDPEVGAINRLLRSLGIPGSRWLNGTDSAMPTVALVGTWKGLGYYVVLFMAGLLNIPAELYDAALVDGANSWQRFWKVTIPLLSNTVLFVSVMFVIVALQEFTLPQVLTGGGPGDATMMYNMLIYDEAFVDVRFGTASAAAIMEFAVILVMTLVQFKILRPKWQY